MPASKCKDCGTELKPLFNSWYCPNDCDTPEGQARNKAKKEAEAKNQYEEAIKKLQGAPIMWPNFFVPVQPSPPLVFPVNYTTSWKWRWYTE